MQGVEDHIEQLDYIIRAAENWAKGYEKSPDTHAKLIKADARLERKLRAYFKDLGAHAASLVNWTAYEATIKAYNIQVIVKEAAIDALKGELVNIMFNDISIMTAIGAQAGEDIYKVALGLDSSTAIIQDIARNHVAELVGMKFKDGILVPNPRADYAITDTIRDDIRSSVQSSLALGENIDDATSRLESVIANPKRAEVIARTETVNSYGQGLKQFGIESGAVAKEWQDNGAVDVCADNADQGIIDINDTFTSGDDVPAAHPNCRCTIRLVYQNELDDSEN